MTVSVLMAAYNVAPYIGRAIESVIHQTHGDWELIVIDDFSRDDTVRTVARFAERDPRIRLLRQPENRGPAAARNAGLEVAKGEWVAVLDGDDAWRPERLETLLHWARETGVEFVADNQLRFDFVAGQVVGTAGRFRTPFEPIGLRGFFDNKSCGKPLGYGLLKPVIDAKFLRRHGIRYQTALRYGEDFRFYVDIFAAGARGIVVSEPHYIYTMPVGSRSNARSLASRTPRNDEATLAVVDGIIAAYADRIDPDTRRSLLRCRRRVLDGVLVTQLRAHGFRTGRLGEALFLLCNPRTALARIRRLFYAMRSAMP